MSARHIPIRPAPETHRPGSLGLAELSRWARVAGGRGASSSLMDAMFYINENVLRCTRMSRDAAHASHRFSVNLDEDWRRIDRMADLRILASSN